MLITRSLEKELRESPAWVLLSDGKDDSGHPRFTLRKVQGTWGQCDCYKGGVCFAPLTDGTDHIRYESVLGYNTGRRASVQELILMEHPFVGWSLSLDEWNSIVTAATEKLLEAQPVNNPRLTVKALTTTRYWYLDNWYRNKCSFVSLRDAKHYAKRQTGISVTIYSAAGDIICFAPASGYCPP